MLGEASLRLVAVKHVNTIWNANNFKQFQFESLFVCATMNMACSGIKSPPLEMLCLSHVEYFCNLIFYWEIYTVCSTWICIQRRALELIDSQHCILNAGCICGKRKSKDYQHCNHVSETHKEPSNKSLIQRMKRRRISPTSREYAFLQARGVLQFIWLWNKQLQINWFGFDQ